MQLWTESVISNILTNVRRAQYQTEHVVDTKNESAASAPDIACFHIYPNSTPDTSETILFSTAINKDRETGASGGSPWIALLRIACDFRTHTH